MTGRLSGAGDSITEKTWSQTGPGTSTVAARRLAGVDSVIARVAADLVARIRQLTIDINERRSQL
jgi:hypothetical protein